MEYIVFNFYIYIYLHFVACCGFIHIFILEKQFSFAWALRMRSVPNNIWWCSEKLVGIFMKRSHVATAPRKVFSKLH